MGGKNDAPPPPDYTPIANASAASAAASERIAKEQLAWAKEQYYSDRQVSDMVVGAALDRMGQQDQWAAEDRARYQQKFQPLEDELIADAKSYATPERQAAEAGKAQADVANQFEQARNAAQDRLESFGIDPSQVRAGALDVSTRTQQAAASAAAGNQARANTEAMGRAMRSEAINIGRGYPGQIATTYNTALQSGNQAVNSQLATTGSGAQTMGTGLQWTGMQNQALGTWSNALTAGYNAQMAQYNANQNSSSGIGSALGLIGGIGGKLLTGGLFEDGGPTDDVPQGMPQQAIPDGDPRNHQGVFVDPRLSPSQGQQTDDVSARLNAGEFVVPKDVVAFKGEEFFQKLIQNARKGKENAPAKPQTMAIPE